MSQVSQLSPELMRGLLQLARALLVAARNWTLYPPEHPTVGVSVARLAAAIQDSSSGAVFSVGVTPGTLMIEGTMADASQAGIAEAAEMLHEHDILTLTFIGDVPPEALHKFLHMLTMDGAGRRAHGGPAGMWAADGHEAVAVEQIDYQKVVARAEGEGPVP